MIYDRNNLPEELLNLPDSAFESLHQEDIKDEKFQTKPIGFFKDAMIRLSHSKVSMLSVALIVLIILLARTKGLTRAQAIVRHAFRNSMMPITSTLVALITGIMGGSLVVESMFAIPGTGGMLVKSIFAGDHFLTVAILIFYSAISLTTILVVDLSYSLIDPRVRVGGGK